MAKQKAKKAKNGNLSLSDQLAAVQANLNATPESVTEVPALAPEVEVVLNDVTAEQTKEHFTELLDELSKYSKAVQDSAKKAEAAKRRYEELQIQVKEKTSELETQSKKVKGEQAELKAAKENLVSKEQVQVSRERELEEREINARANFVRQNEEALAELKEDTKALEKKRNELKLKLAGEETTEREKLTTQLDGLRQKTEQDLKAKRDELDNLKNQLDQDKRRIEVSGSRLATQRSQFEERKQMLEAEIAADYQEKISQKERQLERLQKFREKDLENIQQLEAEIDGYAEVVRILDGQNPETLLDRLHELEHNNRELNKKLDSQPQDDLQTENQALKNHQARLESQLRDNETKLNRAERELSANRLSILEHERLEQENLVLTKHKQSLGAHITELESRLDDLLEKQQGSRVFESLWEMDADRNCQMKPSLEEVPRLDAFAFELQQMIASTYTNTPLYYRLQDVRLFLAGLAMSKLHILQGISGTGKTSLAKAFARVMGGNCTDIAVQAGWRDRDDLLGHFNAFERKYYSKETLKALYKARTPGFEDRVNIVLLDEMNLSRPEQYFAEFLSAIEKQPEDRQIVLLDHTDPNPPKMMTNGNTIMVPDNVWFIGTANHDETTNEFADKTYDRAHVMELPRHEDKFKIRNIEQKTYSFSSLQKRFDFAKADFEGLTNDIIESLTASDLTNVMADQFDIGWGNRLERHARSFIPVVMASDGTVGEALDHLLATKVFRAGKVTGRFDTEEADLNLIRQALEDTWIEMNLDDEPSKCFELIERDLRRKRSGA